MARKTETQEEPLDLTKLTPAELLGEDEDSSGSSHEYVPAVRSGGGLQISDDLGDLDSDSAKKPYLTVVHGVGAASESFSPGELILDKEHLMAKKGEPIEIIILNREAYWKEYLSSYQPGVFPRLYQSKEDAAADGLRVEWQNGQGPDVRPAMDLIVLIKKPEGSNCTLFNINLGSEDEWALAIFSRDKTAYDVLMEDIRHVAKGKLRQTGWFGGSWELYTELKKFKNGNSTWITRARFLDMLPEDQYNKIAEVMSS